MPMARRKKRPTSMGAPSSRSSGSPPGSSSTSIGPTAFAHELQRPHRPRAIELVLQSVFVRETIEARARRVLGGGQNDEHGAPVAVIAQAPPSAQDAFAVLRQNPKFIRIHAAQRIRHQLLIHAGLLVAFYYVPPFSVLVENRAVSP